MVETWSKSLAMHYDDVFQSRIGSGRSMWCDDSRLLIASFCLCPLAVWPSMLEFVEVFPVRLTVSDVVELSSALLV